MRAARLRGGGAVAFVQIGEIFYVEIDAEEGEEEVGKITWRAGKKGEAVLSRGDASGTAS